MSAKDQNKKLLYQIIQSNKQDVQYKYIDYIIDHIQINIINLEDNYKIIESLDIQSNCQILKSYGDMKNYLGIRKEVFKNELDIIAICQQFQEVQNLQQILNKDTIVKSVDIFIDKNSLNNEDKLHIWFIFEEVQYILYNSYYIQKTTFKNKHVLKHYEEKEIFKILKDLIELVQQLQQLKKRINFWNFFVCYQDNQYKFLVLDIHSINEDQIMKDVFTDQIKFVALIIYGLVKELIGAFYHFNPENLDQLIELFQTGRLQGFQQSINLIIEILARKDEIEEKRISDQHEYLQQNIEKYLDILFVFKDDEIFLVNQPIFKYAKKISFQISKFFLKKEEAFEVIIRTLREQQGIQDISLLLGECCLSRIDLQKISQCLNNINDISNIYLDFQNSQLDDQSVLEIMNHLDTKKLVSIKLFFSNTLITKKSYKLILDKISEIPDRQLRVCGLELIQKEYFKKKSIKDNKFQISKSISIQGKIKDSQFELWIITKKGFLNLSIGIACLTDLELLDLILYQNEVDSDKFDILISAIQNCTKLKKLSLNVARNNLGNLQLKNFGKSLMEMKNLEELEVHFYGNQFSTKRLEKFLIDLQLIKLKKFVFSIKEYIGLKFEGIDSEIVKQFELLQIEDKRLCQLIFSLKINQIKIS